MRLTQLPVVVSIATIPSRIGQLRPTLDSLLEGSLGPDRIIVAHPKYCEWEKSGYVVPAFLSDPAYCRGIVDTVVSSKDWGPGTKLLGALENIDYDCFLVLADDDVSYHPNFLAGLMELQMANLGTSYSYYTYRTSGIRFGQGCDGFSFYSPNLTGVHEFASKHVEDTTLLYHDDLWIGFFLFKQGIKVRQVSNPSPGELVYSQLLANDVLSAPKDVALVRDRILRDHLPRLLAGGHLSVRQRVLLTCGGIFDFSNDLRRRVLARMSRIRTDAF